MDFPPGSLEIGNEIAVTSTMAALRSVIDGDGPTEVRLLVGYAGWGPEQLQRELAKGAWLPAPPDAALLFDDLTSTLWQRAYQHTIGSIPAAFVGSTRGSAQIFARNLRETFAQSRRHRRRARSRHGS